MPWNWSNSSFLYAERTKKVINFKLSFCSLSGCLKSTIHNLELQSKTNLNSHGHYQWKFTFSTSIKKLPRLEECKIIYADRNSLYNSIFSCLWFYKKILHLRTFINEMSNWSGSMVCYCPVAITEKFTHLRSDGRADVFR